MKFLTIKRLQTPFQIREWDVQALHFSQSSQWFMPACGFARTRAKNRSCQNPDFTSIFEAPDFAWMILSKLDMTSKKLNFGSAHL